jgi:hypothetical protein
MPSTGGLPLASPTCCDRRARYGSAIAMAAIRAARISAMLDPGRAAAPPLTLR